jgi:hypothetical protein
VSEQENTGGKPASDSDSCRRHSLSRFTLSSTDGVTIDGVSVTDFLARADVQDRLQQLQGHELPDVPIVVDAGPQPPA